MSTEPPAPTVDPSGITQIADGVFIIPDNRVPLVPNIGIVCGSDTALVIDCGMGPQNGARVLEAARKVAGDRRLVLTLTHFHPEHGFGAQAFEGVAKILYNRAQGEELKQKGAGYIEMFAGFGAPIAAALEGTELVEADRWWDGTSETIDLGGRTVEFRTWGMAHTRGDQVVWLRNERILFTGDLAENRIFPIFPYFPPDETDIDAANWAQALTDMEALDPAIVVPGHGAVGGPEILVAVRAYLEAMATRVAALRTDGIPDETIAERLTAEMTTAHPDWDAPEWIGFAARYYADRG